MPMNAKMTTPAVLSTALVDGTSDHTRCDGSMKNTPIATNASSGSSFAIVIASMTRAPVRTPRRLMATSAATRATIRTGAAHSGSAGKSARMERATRLETAAATDVPAESTRQPVTKPAIGPRAAST